MDFSEFLRRIGAEPRSDDPALKAGRAADPRFEAAAAEAEALEDNLERALRVPVDEAALADGLIAATLAASDDRDDGGERNGGGRGSGGTGPARGWRWMAMAATLVLAVGVAGVLLRPGGPGVVSQAAVDEYVRDHYRHDGAKVLAMAADDRGGKDLARILAALGARADETLAGRVDFVKFCPTPHGRGAHMIVRTSEGPVTVIFMPDTEITEPHRLRFDAMEAELLVLRTGSAAIIGAPERNTPELANLLFASIQPLSANAADA